jgi:hypothetical protein
MNLPHRRYKLSDDPRSFDLSCGPEGLTLAGVSLLERAGQGFVPRPAHQVHWLVDQAYQGEIDPASLIGGLEVVARSLNEGEIARAMIAAVMLRLPELDWDGAARIAQAENALAKAGFDPGERRDSRGRWTTTGTWVGRSPANDHLRAPGRANSPFPHGRLPQRPPTDGTDDAYLLEIARNSDFHDEIRDAMADHLRMDGLIVATEVSFILDGTNVVARADIVAMKPDDPTTLAIVEIKTGPRSRLSDAQSWVYPSFVHGEIVSSLDPRIIAFGYSVGQPIPPSAVTIWYEESPAAEPVLTKVTPTFPFIWQPP